MKNMNFNLCQEVTNLSSLIQSFKKKVFQQSAEDAKKKLYSSKCNIAKKIHRKEAKIEEQKEEIKINETSFKELEQIH